MSEPSVDVALARAELCSQAAVTVMRSTVAPAKEIVEGMRRTPRWLQARAEALGRAALQGKLMSKSNEGRGLVRGRTSRTMEASGSPGL